MPTHGASDLGDFVGNRCLSSADCLGLDRLISRHEHDNFIDLKLANFGLLVVLVALMLAETGFHSG